MRWSNEKSKIGLYLLILLGLLSIIYFIFADSLTDSEKLAVVSKSVVTYNNVLYKQVRTTPVNRWNLTNPNISPKSGLVILVITTPQEANRRKDIRTTWANVRSSQKLQENRVSVVFLTGKSGNVGSLLEENGQHNDLLIMDLQETYRNIVYKEFLAFRWLNENHAALAVAKVDSDVILNVDRLVQLFEQKEKDELWIQCSTLTSILVRRDPANKWYVPNEVYPDKYFPPYCNGPMYAMSAGVVGKLLASAENTKIFEVEDAFFTGVLRQNAGVALIENGNFYKTQPCYQACSNGVGTIIGYPNHRKKEIGLIKAFEEFEKIECKSTILLKISSLFCT